MNHLSKIALEEKRYFRLFLLVLLCLSLFMVCWFEPASEYTGHDYYFHIWRFNALIDALKSGDFLIYLDYSTLEGYGYFTKAFYPDLVLLPFAILGIFTGTDFAYNTIIFVMTFLCGLFMYRFIHLVFKNSFIAAVSSILYTFSAYHMFDWYNRSALGESISFTFLPLVFLGVYYIILGDYKKWYILTIGYSLLIYTHLLSSFMTFSILVLLVLICYKPLLKEPKRIAYLVLAALVTIPITGSYIFSMLEQMASNTFHYQESENITGWQKLGLLRMGWGMLSGIVYSKGDNMVGIGPILIILIAFRFFVKEKTNLLRIADVCLLIGIMCMICISSIFPWGRLPLGFIQFPWRLYEFVTFFLAISGAYYLSVFMKSKKAVIASSLVIISFTIITIVGNNSSYKYYQTYSQEHAPEWFTGIPSVNNKYHLNGLEYLPKKLPSYQFIHERGRVVKANSQQTEIKNLEVIDRVTSFHAKVVAPEILELPLIYYKGYKASLNEKELVVKESEFGLVQIEINESGNVQASYKMTLIQKVGWAGTIISILFLCIYIFIERKKRCRNKEVG